MKMLAKAIVMLIVLALALTPVTACRGPAGPQGPQGEQGPVGPPGSDGAQQAPLDDAIYALYETYDVMSIYGNGYTISYPKDWFLSHVSPEEIRLTPPTDSTGGLIAIRATVGMRILGGYYYNNPTGHLRMQENLLQNYSKTMGIDISEVQYNGPVIRVLGLYEDWNWIITFEAIYRGQNMEGWYFIKDFPPYESFTYLYVRYVPDVQPWYPDTAHGQFMDIFRSFRFTNVE